MPPMQTMTPGLFNKGRSASFRNVSMFCTRPAALSLGALTVLSLLSGASLPQAHAAPTRAGTSSSSVNTPHLGRLEL